MTDELRDKYLVFTVDERYAVEIDSIVQIIEYSPITPVPETPGYIAGVINMRGIIVPVVDLRARFRKKTTPPETRRCIVIVNFEGVQLGLLVDSVLNLVTIPPEQLTPPPQVGSDYAHIFVKDIGLCDGEMNLILDHNQIVNHSDLEFLDDEALQEIGE